jgi:hypothetical protein
VFGDLPTVERAAGCTEGKWYKLQAVQGLWRMSLHANVTLIRSLLTGSLFARMLHGKINLALTAGIFGTHVCK